MRMWKDWLSAARCTISFIIIVAVVTTATALLSERGTLNPLDLELSLTQWWGIFTAHWVNRSLDDYLGNIRGLLTFAGLFIATTVIAYVFSDRDSLRRIDSRFPWVVLGSAILAGLALWLGYYVYSGTGSGMGASAMVSAAFGAGAYSCAKMLFIASGKGRVALAAFAVFFIPYLFLYGLFGPLASLYPHWASFSLSILVSRLAFHKGDRHKRNELPRR